MIFKALRKFEQFGSPRVGAVMLMLLAVVAVGLFKKTELLTNLSRGDDLQVTFARDYHLRGYVTKVKIAGVPVGIVTSVDDQPGGQAVVTMHLNNGVTDKLGNEPKAAIRPTTLLGGNYYVELTPGGAAGSPSAIPASRTTVPVELDRVLETLQPTTRVSTQHTIARLNSSLDSRGRSALRGIVTDAPRTLRPLGITLRALEGKNPNDLSVFVTNLKSAAQALSDESSDVDASVRGLSTVSSAIADSSPEVARTVRDLPHTLSTARAGLSALGTTLDQLKSVSNSALPTARQLSTTLTALDPAIRDLRPVVRDLRPALVDLRPTVRDLVPSAISGTRVVDDLKNRPLRRVNGPLLGAVYDDWHGTGMYSKGGNDHLLYQEIGNMIAGMDNASRMTDHNGSTIHFQPGFGVGSLSGTPISFEQLIMQLAYPGGAK